MNKIGIIGAMDEEIEILKSKIILSNTVSIANMDFFEGEINERDIVLVKCGIGKVNSAICTQVLISIFKVDSIINTGVAGAIYDGLDVGEIVISKDVIQHDFDATGFGYKLGQIPRLDEYIFKADESLVNIAKDVCEKETDTKVFVGRVLSGDIFVADASLKDRLWKEFGGYCAEMEGAAIGQVCYLNKIPFVILRSMSDKADGSAHINFNEFVQKTSVISSNIVEKMIQNM